MILISLLIFSNRPHQSPIVFGRLGFVKKETTTLNKMLENYREYHKYRLRWKKLDLN